MNKFKATDEWYKRAAELEEGIEISAGINRRPLCKECGKEIWGISHIHYTIGVELPTLLHSVCYERLLENAGGDK